MLFVTNIEWPKCDMAEQILLLNEIFDIYSNVIFDTKYFWIVAKYCVNRQSTLYVRDFLIFTYKQCQFWFWYFRW
jgi:hypothetical protein